MHNTLLILSPGVLLLMVLHDGDTHFDSPTGPVDGMACAPKNANGMGKPIDLNGMVMHPLHIDKPIHCQALPDMGVEVMTLSADSNDDGNPDSPAGNSGGAAKAVRNKGNRNPLES